MRMTALVLVIYATTASLGAAQAAPPRFLVLDERNHDALQKVIQEAADRGYRLLPGQGGWDLRPILEKVDGNTEPVEYIVVGARLPTLKKEMEQRAAEGYRFATLLDASGQVVVAMQRRKGTTTRTHEQLVLETQRAGTLERELNATEIGPAFRIVAQRALGGQVYLVILERPVP